MLAQPSFDSCKRAAQSSSYLFGGRGPARGKKIFMASRQDAWTRLPDDRIIHPYPFDIKLNPQPQPFAPISAAAIISSNRCRRRPYPRRRCRQPSNSSPAGSTPPFFPDRPADPTPEQLRFSILSSTFRSTGLSAPAAAAVRRLLPNFGRILCPTLRSVVPPAVALVPVLLGFRISEPLDWRLSFLAVVVFDCRFGIVVAGLWLSLESKKKKFPTWCFRAARF